MTGTKILVAPNSFKGGLDAWSIAPLIERGLFFGSRILGIPVSTELIPVSDGGTGFRRVICQAHTTRRDDAVNVRHPFQGRRSGVVSFIADKTAVIESAEFIGLALIPAKHRNPLGTSSYPLGEAIRHAIGQGAERIIIGGGDSATCDAGIGLIAALGARIFDDQSNLIEFPTGRDIARVSRIDLRDCLLPKYDGQIELACNLTSIAAGPGGTGRVYARQKGASEDEAQQLANSIDRLAELLVTISNKKDQSRLPGSGSAGGIALPLMTFAIECDPRYSFELTFEALSIDSKLDWADIVITGEGAFDKNSIKGKAPVALAQRAKLHNCTTIALVGSIEQGITSRLLRSGLDCVEPLSDTDISIESYMNNAERLIIEATVRAFLKVFLNA